MKKPKKRAVPSPGKTDLGRKTPAEKKQTPTAKKAARIAYARLSLEQREQLEVDGNVSYLSAIGLRMPPFIESRHADTELEHTWIKDMNTKFDLHARVVDYYNHPIAHELVRFFERMGFK